MEVGVLRGSYLLAVIPIMGKDNMTEILVVKKTFWYKGNFYPAGTTVHAGHPLVTGREHLFSPMVVDFSCENESQAESHEEHEHFVVAEEAAEHVEEAQAHDEDAAELLDELPKPKPARPGRGSKK